MGYREIDKQRERERETEREEEKERKKEMLLFRRHGIDEFSHDDITI